MKVGKRMFVGFDIKRPLVTAGFWKREVAEVRSKGQPQKLSCKWISGQEHSLAVKGEIK